MRITIINGPNLNLLGKREPGIYGNATFGSVLDKLRDSYRDIDIEYFQSNHEGDIIDRLQEEGFGKSDGIILNAGAYTHTSVSTPVVEVHISNVHAREEFRHRSMLSRVCRGIIIGFGTDVYRLAVESFLTK